MRRNQLKKVNAKNLDFIRFTMNDLASGAVHELAVSDMNGYSEDEFPSQPGPVRIIVPVEEDHTFRLKEDFLERILLNPKFADKKVFLSRLSVFQILGSRNRCCRRFPKGQKLFAQLLSSLS